MNEAKRSDVPFGHASMLLLGEGSEISEGSEATEPYNKDVNHHEIQPFENNR